MATPNYLVLANYKAPLRKVPDGQGYGYFGALTTTTNKDLLQCHICGKLFPNIGAHLKKHRVSPKEYKKKFELATKTSLLCDMEREKYKKRGLEKWSSLTKVEKDALVKNLNEFRYKGHPVGWTMTLETKNKRGNCPDQILDRIRAIAKRLGHTPTSTEFRADIKETNQVGLWDALRRTFGTYRNAVYKADLPKPIGKKDRKFTDFQLLQMLKEFHERTGLIPTASDCGNGLLPHASLYDHHLGGLPKARSLAGIREDEDRLRAPKRNPPKTN